MLDGFAIRPVWGNIWDFCFIPILLSKIKINTWKIIRNTYRTTNSYKTDPPKFKMCNVLDIIFYR